jgi:serine/threonine protein kinase/Flp pilus assembly protein TadD
MIGHIVSHYRILDKIGEGGMGIVYVAEDMHLGRQVAIKFLTAERDKHQFRARFLREARSASALSHPHIATVYDYGETRAGQPFIVMELVRGRNLSDLLADGALTLQRAVEVIVHVAEALSEAHRLGIIHRDIKPTNVAVNERGQVKVFDFGLAKLLNDEFVPETTPDARTLLATQTRDGVVIGTPLYLSPEQATGAQVDARSDLFALGALLYECIAGRPAFQGESVIEICAQVLHADPLPPSEFNPRIPAELDRITLKALAKRPEDRYQSADELIADLRAVQAALPDVDHVPARLTPLQSSAARLRALTTLPDELRRPRYLIPAFLLMLSLAMFVWWEFQPGDRPFSADARWHYQIGVDALRNGAPYQATQALDLAIKNDKNFSLAKLRLAEAWMLLDDPDRARDALLRVLAPQASASELPPLEELRQQALTATLTGEATLAAQLYEKIAQQAPDAEKPYAYFCLGRAYENAEATDKAINSYIEATNRNPQYAPAYLRLGMIHARKHNLEDATASFNKAEEIYRLMANHEGLAEVLYQRGVLFNKQMDKNDEARRQFQQVIDLARNTGNDMQHILALLQLSDIALVEGATAQAEQLARAAIENAQQHGLQNIATRGIIKLGDQSFLRGDYDGAETKYKQALAMAQTNRSPYNTALSQLMLGSLKTDQRRNEEALGYLRPALDFYQKEGYEKEVSIILTLMARANRNTGHYDAALEALRQLLQHAEKIGNTNQIMISHNEIGKVLFRQERYAEALDHFTKAAELSNSLGDQARLGYSLVYRSNANWRVGRYEEARELLKQAYALAGRTSNKGLLAESYTCDAWMALSERRFAEAKKTGQRALELSKGEFKDTDIQAHLVIGLAQTYSGDRHEGRLACQKAVKMATDAGDPWLLFAAQLALAESMLEDGDAQGALAAARQAQEGFARTGQQESELRAWLLAARASRRMNEETMTHDYISHIKSLMTDLQRKWGADIYNQYIARPDIRYSREQLNQV